MYRHFPNQRLHIGAQNTLGHVLLRHDFAVQQRDRHQIGQTVVSLFLGSDRALVAFFSAADDVVSNVENVHINMIDLVAA